MWFGMRAAGQRVAALVLVSLPVLAIGGTFVVVGQTNGSPAGLVLCAVIAGAGLAPAVYGGRAMLRAKRYRAESAPALLARDPRPPVVYLRSFAQDPTAARAVNSTAWITEEEQLAMVMNEIGPFVAIGMPGEVLPELGAARFYVAGDEWQRAILTLLSRSRLAVLRIARSPGFWWEVETVTVGGRPEKVLLLVPRDEHLYEEFRHRFRALTGHELPRLTGWNRRRRYRGSLQAAIFFDHRWAPTVVGLQTYRVPLLRRSVATPLVPVLKLTLRPVFERVGAPWTAPGLGVRTVLAIAGIVFLILDLLCLVGMQTGEFYPPFW